LAEYSAEHPNGSFQLLLLLGSINALAYNVVHYLMIQRTSAVTTTVLGEVKIIGLLLLSALLLGMYCKCPLNVNPDDPKQAWNWF
jgi:hypothetical protein